MPVYRALPIEACIIDPRYQRDKDENHIERIVKEFDPAMFSVLEASERESGEYAIFDGQQRLIARQRMIEREIETGKVTLPSLVHTGLTAEDEANLFVQLQDKRKPISPVDRFRARLFAKDPVAEGMVEVASQHRYKIGLGPNTIQAIVAAERAYRRENFGTTLAVISKNWRGEPGSLEASIIDGISRFLLLYDQDINFDYLYFKLEDIGPKTLLRRAADVRSSSSGSKAGGVVVVLRDLYSDRQHPLLTVEAAQKARTTKESEGRKRYVRVSREQVREVAFTLPEGWRIQDLQEALGGVSKAALTNAKTGHVTKLVNAGTLKWRQAKDGELPGRHYYVAPVTGPQPSRPKRVPVDKERTGMEENFDQRGTPVRAVNASKRRQAGSKPGEGKRMRDRDREYEKQQAAKAERAAKDREKALVGSK